MTIRLYRRVYVTEYHGNNKATFECKNGHKWKDNLLKKRRGIPLPGEAAQKMLAEYWKQGVTFECPRCKAIITKKSTGKVLND